MENGVWLNFEVNMSCGHYMHTYFHICLIHIFGFLGYTFFLHFNIYH